MHLKSTYSLEWLLRYQFSCTKINSLKTAILTVLKAVICSWILNHQNPMTGCWFEFLQEKGIKNCKINNHQGCHLEDHYKWNYHDTEHPYGMRVFNMQLESLNSVAKLMKEGLSDNKSVIMTAIKYSCNPDNYLISPHFCIFHCTHYIKQKSCWSLWILWILLLVI